MVLKNSVENKGFVLPSDIEACATAIDRILKLPNCDCCPWIEATSSGENAVFTVWKSNW